MSAKHSYSDCKKLANGDDDTHGSYKGLFPLRLRVALHGATQRNAQL